MEGWGGGPVPKLSPERAGMYTTMSILSQCFPALMVSLGSEEAMRISNRHATILELGGAKVLVAAVPVVVGIADRRGGWDGAKEMNMTKRLADNEDI